MASQCGDPIREGVEGETTEGQDTMLKWTEWRWHAVTPEMEYIIGPREECPDPDYFFVSVTKKHDNGKISMGRLGERFRSLEEAKAAAEAHHMREIEKTKSAAPLPII
jgi:hypothetical protein